jgi:hypothetical protein
MTGEPPGVSLRSLGLTAPDGLVCPEGGYHHILEPELIIVSARGGGTVRCQKCAAEVELRSLTAL